MLASQNIIARRIELGINQTELANRVSEYCLECRLNLRIDTQHISSWERNISQPNYRLIPMLAQGLEWDIDELLDSTEWYYEDGLLSQKNKKVTKHLKQVGGDVLIFYIDISGSILKALGLWFSIGFVGWFALYIIQVSLGIQSFTGNPNPSGNGELAQLFDALEPIIGIVTASGFLVQSVIDWFKAIRLNMSL